MPFNQYIGRKIIQVNIMKDEDVNLTNVVKYHAVLKTDTPVRVNGELLEQTDDSVCDDSFWPYVEGEKLEIRFDDQSATRNLGLYLTVLVPNPNYCEHE